MDRCDLWHICHQFVTVYLKITLSQSFSKRDKKPSQYYAVCDMHSKEIGDGANNSVVKISKSEYETAKILDA
jgi:hypothetical protein